MQWYPAALATAAAPTPMRGMSITGDFIRPDPPEENFRGFAKAAIATLRRGVYSAL
jgi:hypothetical protein